MHGMTSSASLGSTEHSQVDMLGRRTTPFKFPLQSARARQVVQIELGSVITLLFGLASLHTGVPAQIDRGRAMRWGRHVNRESADATKSGFLGGDAQRSRELSLFDYVACGRLGRVSEPRLNPL